MAGTDLSAAGLHAHGAPALDDDLLDQGVLDQVHALAVAGLRHRLRERVRAAQRHAPVADHPGKRVEDRAAGAGRIDADAELHARAIEQGAHLRRLEELVDHDLRGLDAVGGGDADVSVDRLDEGVLASRDLGRGRVVDADGEEGAEVDRPLLEQRVEVGVGLGVAGDARVRLLEQVLAVKDDRRAAVGERDPALVLGGHGAQAAVLEAEVLDHRDYVEELHVVGVQVEAEAGEDGLLGVGAAPLLVASLHYAGREAGARQVCGEAEPVVPGSDDDRVVGVLHVFLHGVFRREDACRHDDLAAERVVASAPTG